MTTPDLTVSEFANGLKFWVRDGTNDHNVAHAAAFEDEYGLDGIDVSGKLAFDVGAHIGSVGISLAKRGAHVVCMEPVPENAELIRRNAELNGVEVSVIEAAAGWSGTKVVRWGFAPLPGWNEMVERDPNLGNLHNDQIRTSIHHHRFVGSSNNAAPVDQLYDETEVPCFSLEAMAMFAFGCPDIIKIDCEGGEWPWLLSYLAPSIPLWVGEWHPWGDEDREGAGTFRGHARHGRYTRDTLEQLLRETHDVSFTGYEAGPGGFRAERR